MKFAPILALCLLASRTLADEAPRILALPTEVLYSDTFERAELGDAWQAPAHSFAIKDGAMVGGMRDAATHPAITKVSRPFGNIILSFSFRFDGARSFSIVFNDINEKSVHSGHVARMSVTPTSLTITDDKTGLMSLESMEKKKDPAMADKIEQVRAEKSRRFPFDGKEHRWYKLVMEVVGDEVLVSIDGKPAGYYRCPGYGHPTKTSFHWSISGRDLSVDNLTAWKAAPNPAWEQKRSKVLASLKTQAP